MSVTWLDVCHLHVLCFVLLLCSVRFDTAFDLMKKHRINMNLMYDHNPAAFHANTETFVCQLDLPANINLFLTDLRFNDTGTCLQS